MLNGKKGYTQKLRGKQPPFESVYRVQAPRCLL